MGGELPQTKLMLFSIQVEVGVELGNKLGLNWAKLSSSLDLTLL